MDVWQLATWLVRAAIVAIAVFAGWMTIGFGGWLCVALAVWLGWRLARRVTTPRATTIAGAGVVAALVLGLFVVIPVAKGFCALPGADRFDAATWRADDADWPCSDRAGMVPDLLNDILKPGMSEHEVVELLGPPVSDPGIAWPHGDALIWKVSCAIDCEWVVVSTENGEVTDIELASD